MRPFRQRDNEESNSDDRSVDGTADELARIAAELEVWDGSAPAESVPQGERGRRMASLAGALKGSLSAGWTRGASLVGSSTKDGALRLVDRLTEAVPRIPVRDLRTLRAQHPRARSAEDLADSITGGAVKASSSVGAGVGAAAMLPIPPAMAVEIASELLAVAAIEIKMIAELYQIYGQPVPGNTAQRTSAYLSVWSHRRGLDLTRPGTVVALGAGKELRQQLRKRLTRSGLRKLPSLTPMMVGAVAGAVVNRRDTAKLALEIRRDLRARPPGRADYWTDAAPPPVLPGGAKPRRKAVRAAERAAEPGSEPTPE